MDTNHRIAIYFSGRVYSYNTLQLNELIHSLELQTGKQIDLFASCGTHIKSFNSFIDILPVKAHSFIDVEIPDYIYTLNTYGKTTRPTCYNMYYHNLNAFNLIETYMNTHNIVYDIIIKYRADITVTNDTIKIDKCMDNTIYIPEGSDWDGGINDQIAYGNFNSMKKYSNLVNNIKQLCTNGIAFHPETLLRAHLLDQKLTVRRFPFKYVLNSCRQNHA